MNSVNILLGLLIVQSVVAMVCLLDGQHEHHINQDLAAQVRALKGE